METAPASSTPTDPPPSSSSDPPPAAPPPSSSDPPVSSSSPPPEPPPPSSAPPPPTPVPVPPQTQIQTLEPQQQPPQPQQRPVAVIPRPRVPTQSMPRGVGGGSGIAIGVPASFQRPQSTSPFSSFRPSNPFSAPSFVHSFGGMPRSSAASGPEASSSSPSQPRPPVPSVQTIGMIGSLSTVPNASQMRPSGVPGQNQQRLGQPQVRSGSPSVNQTSNSQKFPSLGGPRAPSMTSPGSQTPTPQGSPSLPPQWMQSHGKQSHAASLTTSSYRSQMRPPTMQQRPQHPQQQQHQLPMASHMQVSASQQQQQQQQQQKQQLQQQLQQMQHQQQHSSLPNKPQEHHPLRNPQSIPSQHQAARALVPTNPKLSVQALAQHGLANSANFNDPDELTNDIISRKRIRELVAQVDRSEKLRPEIEDDLLEIADDFVESIVTAACQLAKHRKSTTLEAKDILLHVERRWNMTLPGFSGDEIKCYKKPTTNDIHKERLAMIKKSMVGSNEGSNARAPASAGGQSAANQKLHAPKTPAPTEA